jgi:hypothetical protein
MKDRGSEMLAYVEVVLPIPTFGDAWFGPGLDAKNS